MTSETYQQASNAELGLRNAKSQVDAGDTPESALRSPQLIDPENRLLWRMNTRRLSFEELRDSLLAASGKLEATVGGKAGDLFSPGFQRRTLYGTIDRQFLPSTLRVFDFASPDLHIPLRSETTVPQQALFFLNHPLMVAYAQALAERTGRAASDEERVRQLYHLAYQRSPTPEQAQAALEFVRLAEQDRAGVIPPTVSAWQYGFGKYDEQTQRVTGFEKLPHFSGSAWQGGPVYPDGKLGWAQLTATGGHPGNDLDHAAVRRWTAPREMRIRVQSTLVHEPQEGEGVRGFLVSSRSGLLKQAAVHHGQADFNVATVEVQAGETLDFVADIGKSLSYNQFLWQATLAADDETALVFDSKTDFENQGQTRLSPWEQLAQVLFSANEFVFVD